VDDGRVRFDRGTVTAGTIVLAAGTGAFPLIAALTGRDLGQGVKGQAALLAAPGASHAADRPMIYTDGLYIVPHADGTVAVGSTSETSYQDPHATDARLDALIDRARRISPALRDAPVLERWAGLRPRAPRPDPMLGPLPGHPRVLAATGGFKTGFGLAPAVGTAIAAMAAGETPPLPPGFTAAEHPCISRACVFRASRASSTRPSCRSQPGLTGVVGPNGCGKSNLLEAIRWVMGESRPTVDARRRHGGRDLRGCRQPPGAQPCRGRAHPRQR
jgi:glycine/D-amino acid oxidase-like deaminating enzyme